MLRCDVCLNDKTQFAEQTELIKHLKTKHLKKYTVKKEIVYRCCYGKNGICEISENEGMCEYTSEKEYENHLLHSHLKMVSYNDKDKFKVTDEEIIQNSLNYDQVKMNQTNIPLAWKMYHSRINLPAVLNDPHNKQLDIFSRTWGEAFEKAEIPPCLHLVPPSKLIFKPYIVKVRNSEKYREESLTKISAKQSVKCPENSSICQKPDLDSVPKIFFQSDFNLNCKDIFSSVIPMFNSSYISTPTNFTLFDNTLQHKLSKRISNRSVGEKWLTDNSATKVNEKLSFYLDIIEVNIVKQVSKRSNSFFEAVSTQDKVRDKLSQALSQISNVRAKLRQSDEELTKNHLLMLLKIQRKKHLQLLLDKLKIVKAVHTAQTVIQTLLSTNDLSGALDLINSTEHILDFDLSLSDNSFSCLKHVKPQLQEVKQFLHKMIQQEYINAISTQLRLEDDWHSPEFLDVDYQLVPSLLAMIRLCATSNKLDKSNTLTVVPFSTHTAAGDRGVNNNDNQYSNIHFFLQLYFNDAVEVSKTVIKSRVLQSFYRTTALNKDYAESPCANSDRNVSRAAQNDSSMITNMSLADEKQNNNSGNVNKLPSNLVDQMRSLDFQTWIDLVRTIMNDMVQLVERVKIGCHTMKETLSIQMSNGNNYGDDNESNKMMWLVVPSISSNSTDVTINDFLTSTFNELNLLPNNIAHSLVHRIIKLVRARSNNGFLEKLTSLQFVQFAQLLLWFVNERLFQLMDRSDAQSSINTQMELSKTVTSCITEHTTRFITRFHNDRREKLQLILDNDIWRPADVPSQLQELATYISNHEGLLAPDRNGVIGNCHDNGKETMNDDVDEHCLQSDKHTMQQQSTFVNAPNSSSSNQSLELDGSKFTVAAAALLLFQMIVEYCQCASVFHKGLEVKGCKHQQQQLEQQQQHRKHYRQHLISADLQNLFNHLITLLELFNSRTCQLVLGAGARKSVELGTISARNLAVSASSLQLVLALIPRIQMHFEQLVGSDTTSSNKLIDVQNAFRDHIDKINRKLVSLLEDRMDIKFATWSGKPPAPSSEMRAVCQQLNRFHDAVCGVYSVAQETELMLRVHATFKAMLRGRMRELKIVMDNGPRHGIVKSELAFYMTHLTAACGLRTFEESFNDVWSK